MWIPRDLQGDGRHDNPDAYGCLYTADRPTSAVVEQLARFRGQRLTEAMLSRRGLPLALAAMDLPDAEEIVDLDDPAVLSRHELRPSRVATRRREVTQPQALALYRARPHAAGIRWWSTFEALWANCTVFDRAIPTLTVLETSPLLLDDPTVAEAAAFLGIANGVGRTT
jgi:hypothetical protein